jgi:hypothetical protein
MFKGKEAAIEISKLMLALGAQLNGSLIRVQERCPSSEFEAYRAVLPASFACFQAPLMSNDRRHTSGTEVLI